MSQKVLNGRAGERSLRRFRFLIPLVAQSAKETLRDAAIFHMVDKSPIRNTIAAQRVTC
jgi:hypothetical protein